MPNILNSYIGTNNNKPEQDNITKFMGYTHNVYLDPAINGPGFIFITRPALFLYPLKDGTSTSYESMAYNNMEKSPKLTRFIIGDNDSTLDAQLIKQLSYYNFSDVRSLFIPAFTNQAKNFSPSDINLDVVQGYQTREGYTMSIPTNTTQSETSNTLTISFMETSNFTLTKICEIWVNYIKNITNGTFTANPDMIKNNMLDYTCSIYYFSLAPDGRTIKYWCRYTGCFPTVIPYSPISYTKGNGSDNIVLDIPFQYTIKEDMDPRLLEDFNMLSLQLVTQTFSSDKDVVQTVLEDVDSYMSNGYPTYLGNNNLLSKTSLLKGKFSNLVKSKERDPIIYYENNVINDLSGKMFGKYVLSFSEDTLTNELFNTLVDDTEAFTYKENT